MLGHVAFGLPNLAALSGGIATSGINPALFVNSAGFGAHTFTAIVPGQINPVRFDNQSVFFNPTITLFGTLNILPQRLNNQNVFGAHRFAWDQALTTQLFVNQSQFFQHSFTPQQPEPTYDFPIGHSLDSDYGIRRAMTFYKQTLVIGRR